jgi:hypothetical protein
MCVQDIDVQCVLQFTLIHAPGCALHRHTSRVIHRLEWYKIISLETFFGLRIVTCKIRSGRPVLFKPKQIPRKGLQFLRCHILPS